MPRSAAKGDGSARAPGLPSVSAGRADGPWPDAEPAPGRRCLGGCGADELAEGDRRRVAQRGERALSQQINLYSPLVRKQKKGFSAVAILQAIGLVGLGVAGFYFYLFARPRPLEAPGLGSAGTLT